MSFREEPRATSGGSGVKQRPTAPAGKQIENSAADRFRTLDVLLHKFNGERDPAAVLLSAPTDRPTVH